MFRAGALTVRSGGGVTVNVAVVETVSQVSETVNVTVAVPPWQRSGGVVPWNKVSGSQPPAYVNCASQLSKAVCRSLSACIECFVAGALTVRARRRSYGECSRSRDGFAGIRDGECHGSRPPTQRSGGVVPWNEVSGSQPPAYVNPASQLSKAVCRSFVQRMHRMFRAGALTVRAGGGVTVNVAVVETVSQVSETVNVTVAVPPRQRSGGVVPWNEVSGSQPPLYVNPREPVVESGLQVIRRACIECFGPAH